MKKILVLNSGSSSLKYQLFNVEGDKYEVVAKGLAERIGIDGSKVGIKYADGTKKEVVNPLPTHNEALQEVFNLLLNGALADLNEITAVGHRVVHGGEIYANSVVIDEKVVQTLIDLSSLAPLHNPAGVLGIRAVQKALPNVPQVAVFDTAFHQTMPKEAFLYGLPLEQYTKHQIRRYGMHGTSHRYIAQEVTKILGDGKKVIVSGSGNVAIYAAYKATSLGGKVIAMKKGESGESGWITIRNKKENEQNCDTPVDKNILVQGVAGSGKTNICIDKIIFTACKNYSGKVLYTTFSRGLLMDTKLKVENYKKDLEKVLNDYKSNNILFLDNNHKKALENRLGIYFFSDDDEQIFDKLQKVIDYLDNKVNYLLIEDIYNNKFGKNSHFVGQNYFLKNY